MIPPRILRKIERCLALSRSANQHEAGIAIRQAQALMAEHGVTEFDVAASRIGRSATRAEAGRHPPRYVDDLATLINAAFGTVAVYETRATRSGWQGYFAFIGPEDSARVAAYAFEVLQRQLVADRKAFLATVHGNAKRITKIRRADAFANAWVIGAAEHIVPIKKSEQTLSAIGAFKKRHYSEPLGELTSHDRGHKRDDHKAMLRGLEAGRQARLHDGVDAMTPQREGLTHG